MEVITTYQRKVIAKSKCDICHGTGQRWDKKYHNQLELVPCYCHNGYVIKEINTTDATDYVRSLEEANNILLKLKTPTK